MTLHAVLTIALDFAFVAIFRLTQVDSIDDMPEAVMPEATA